MPSSRARILLLAAGLSLAAPASEAGDPPPAAPAPPPLVANPSAERWAAFQPGAWVRRETERLDPPQGVPPKDQVLVILREVTPHDVVLWVGTDPGPGGSGTLRVIDRKISAKEAENPWTKADGLEQVAESKARVVVAGTSFDCTLVEASGPLKRGGGTRRLVRTWLHSAVPGGWVRQYDESDFFGRRSRENTDVIAFGLKPDARIAYPPKVEPDDELIEAPAYARWSRFAVGAWIRRTQSLSNESFKRFMRTTEKLVDLRPTCLFTEIQDQDYVLEPVVPSESVPSGPREKDPPVTHEVRRRMRREYLPSTYESRGFTVTESKGKETLQIGARKIVCDTVEVTALHEDTNERVRDKKWFSLEIPGGLAKSEYATSTSSGKHRALTTVLIEDFGVPGK